MTAMIRSEVSVNESVLFVAFELGKTTWKLAMTTGLAVTPWVRTVAAGDLAAVDEVLQRARARFGLTAARVISCYKAGRDGFWIHRALVTRGVENRVVDSSSIEVNRRKRRAKSDRLDAEKLVRLLARVCAGNRGAWSEVRVPSAVGSGAASQPGAADADGGADGAAESNRQLAGHGRGPRVRSRPRAGGVVDVGAGLGWGGVARRRCRPGSRGRRRG